MANIADMTIYMYLEAYKGTYIQLCERTSLLEAYFFIISDQKAKKAPLTLQLTEGN